MEVGFIGLGRMGSNMVNRMLTGKKKNKVVVWNRSPEPVKKLKRKGAIAAKDVEDLVNKLKQKKKVVWLMLPAGKITESHFQKVLSLLKKGDIIIDGANSNFHDTLRRHKECSKKGVDMLDVGVSGGIIAAETGYPMMIGGKLSTWKYCKPLFDSFGIKEGYDLVGPGGAGHYVKMIHNAIEYGMMQSIAEGFDLLAGGRYKNLDLKKIVHVWNHGTIIDSFLMDMTEKSIKKDPKLKKLEPFVSDSGEGRWAAKEAVEQAVPFVCNNYALQARFLSRKSKNSYAFKLLAAIRHEFGGHAVKKK